MLATVAVCALFLTAAPAKADASAPVNSLGLLSDKLPYWEVHRVPGGHAELLAAELKKILTESDSLRIAVLNNNRLLVFARREVHDRIGRMIQTCSVDTLVKMISVGARDAKTTADTLVTWLGAGAPNIAVGDGNYIYVHGTRAQVAEVERLIKALDGAGAGG
jgi:hypothetical protein